MDIHNGEAFVWVFLLAGPLYDALSWVAHVPIEIVVINSVASAPKSPRMRMNWKLASTESIMRMSEHEAKISSRTTPRKTGGQGEFYAELIFRPRVWTFYSFRLQKLCSKSTKRHWIIFFFVFTVTKKLLVPAANYSHRLYIDREKIHFQLILRVKKRNNIIKQ